jgi:hypothetical protein
MDQKGYPRESNQGGEERRKPQSSSAERCSTPSPPHKKYGNSFSLYYSMIDAIEAKIHPRKQCSCSRIPLESEQNYALMILLKQLSRSNFY